MMSYMNIKDCKVIIEKERRTQDCLSWNERNLRDGGRENI